MTDDTYKIGLKGKVVSIDMRQGMRAEPQNEGGHAKGDPRELCIVEGTHVRSFVLCFFFFCFFKKLLE